MEQTRAQTATRLLKGVAVAAILTFPGMLILALCVVFTPMGDATLTILNQLLKALCVFFGALFAVGAGGRRGFAMGAAVGLCYMLLGYGLYAALDGTETSLKMLAAEAAFGAALGAISGAICANLKPRRRSSARKRKRPSHAA